MLDQRVEITVLNSDQRPPPATPLSCGCSSQKMLNTTSLLICSPSDVLLPPTHKRRGAGGREREQEVRLFAGLNALIKLSDHSGRDKEVMPPASLMLAAFALCSAINRHGTAVAEYLTNLALCRCVVDKCSDGG